jgi:hypothetical protein
MRFQRPTLSLHACYWLRLVMVRKSRAWDKICMRSRIHTLLWQVHGPTDIVSLARTWIVPLQTVEQIFTASVPLEIFGSRAIIESIARNGTDHFDIITSLWMFESPSKCPVCDRWTSGVSFFSECDPSSWFKVQGMIQNEFNSDVHGERLACCLDCVRHPIYGKRVETIRKSDDCDRAIPAENRFWNLARDVKSLHIEV